MAKKFKQALGQLELFDQKRTPAWPTFVRRSWPDGRVLNVANEMWLYMAVPMGPMVDARSSDRIEAVADPVMAAFAEVSNLTPPTQLTYRQMVKSSYREVHVLGVSVKDLFAPDPSKHQLAEYHTNRFERAEVDYRSMLFGVRLLPKMESKGLRASVDEVIETFIAGGDPVENFTRDFHDVQTGLTRAGLRRLTPQEFRFADSWWNGGENPHVPNLVHTDHMHIFRSNEAARSAALLQQNADVPCEQWPDLPDSHTINFATVTDFDLPYLDATSPKALWATRLLRHGAKAVSIRGRVEPSKVTRNELRRMRSRYIADIAERTSAGKMERVEQEETLAALHDVEDFYAQGGTPTLIEASTVVAFSGRDPRTGYDPTDIGRYCGVSLQPMTNVQDRALAEVMIGSNVRANPHARDLPSQTVAYAGLENLSTVGDDDGALLGFTEVDRQPAYLHPSAATDADTLPIFLGVGQTGAGKSVLLMWLINQFARMRTSSGERTPVVAFDPKPGSDFSKVAELTGGTTYSLDDLLAADGVFDPLRFSKTPAAGVDQAHATLMFINPWGTPEAKARWETPLLHALNYGVQHGARSTMQALLMAEADHVADPNMVAEVANMINASPMAASMCGRRGDGPRLSTSEGITYIKVGSTNLNLPAPGVAPESMPQRVALQLVRNIVYGSMAALEGRQGVMALDEGWVFTSAGAAEMDRLGRLARSMRIMPMLFSQKVTETLEAGLAGYISRGIILPIQDEKEAVAACELFGLEPTAERIARIRANPFMGDSSESSDSPNWESMRALIHTDPDTKKRTVLRGTIGIYADVKKRAVPTEIVIPETFLEQVSTNRVDAENRAKKVAADREARDLAERQAAESGLVGDDGVIRIGGSSSSW